MRYKHAIGLALVTIMVLSVLSVVATTETTARYRKFELGLDVKKFDEKRVAVMGRLLDPSGRPLAGAPVAVYMVVDNGPAKLVGRATTDALGRYNVKVPTPTGHTYNFMAKCTLATSPVKAVAVSRVPMGPGTSKMMLLHKFPLPIDRIAVSPLIK